MSSPELNFQKEMVVSGRKNLILLETTTDRFKKGRPDLYAKSRQYPTSFHIECKYEVKRKTLDVVPIEVTELQRLCLRLLREAGTYAFISICVEIDKKTKRVYHVYDIDATQLNLHSSHYEPEYKEKGKNIWPIQKMLRDAVLSLITVARA